MRVRICPALMAQIQLPPELEVGEGYGKVSWSVRAIWENYAGWFKHESTTELYTSPRSAVNADLIELAGGAQAIVARAQEKLDQQRYVEALHLLDIVLPRARAGAGRAAHCDCGA
jgi:alkyl sulfatase BDS1-like metallo-beta-lactamase superfamily hydrolase